MLIIDLSNILIANLMQNIKMTQKEGGISEDLLRHMILNTIRMYVLKFKGNRPVVIACDGKATWRKDAFPFYKAKRQTTRDASGLNWSAFYDFFNKIIDELDTFFPYNVIKFDGLEADDIIGTLCAQNEEDSFLLVNDSPEIIIISNDKDMLQLQRYVNVKQFSPLKRKFLIENNPKEFLFRHILDGDSSDGVPNFLSDDDTFVMSDKRQSPLREDRIQKIIQEKSKKDLKDVLGDHYKNYLRNKTLIDLEETPEDLKKKIIEKYEINNKKDAVKQSTVMKYCMQYRLKNLTESVADFLV